MNSISAFTKTFLERFNKPVIAFVNIRGNIDANQTYKIGKSLANVPKKNVKFLAVLVNSAGGAPAQAHIITKKIKAIAQDRKIPVYAFAEDFATSGGYYVLSAGEKVFADSASVIGGIGALSTHVNASKLLKGYDIYYEKYSTNKESLSSRSHFTEKLTKDTQKVFQKILEDTHQQFIQHVEERRAGKLQVPEAERKDKLYDGDIHIAREAKKLGLVDELVPFREYVLNNYPDAKLLDLTRPSLWERMRLVLSKVVAVSSDVHAMNLMFKNYLKN